MDMIGTTLWSVAMGMLLGILTAALGYLKGTTLEKADWEKFGVTVVLGAVIGVVMGFFGWGYDQAYQWLFGMGIIAVIENAGKLLVRRIKDAWAKMKAKSDKPKKKKPKKEDKKVEDEDEDEPEEEKEDEEKEEKNKEETKEKKEVSEAAIPVEDKKAEPEKKVEPEKEEKKVDEPKKDEDAERKKRVQEIIDKKRAELKAKDEKKEDEKEE